MSDDDIGGYRKTDPRTSVDAAKTVKVASIKWSILRALSGSPPLNGWEMSRKLELPTITVVPRLAPMWRDHWIERCGQRPGPSGRQQIAYVITDTGKDVLTKGRPRQLRLPLESRHAAQKDHGTP